MTRILTTQELAELLRVDVATIARWRRTGVLPAGLGRKIGRQYYYSEQAVLDWLTGGGPDNAEQRKRQRQR